MSMRKMLTLLVCLMALASVFISCAAEQQAGDLATVRLSINSERSRTINEEGNKVVKYRFEFIEKDKEGIQYSSEFERGTGVYTMTGIKAGTYSIVSYALNSEDNVVAKKTEEHQIKRGTNSFTVTFDSYSETESGSLSFTIKWDTSEYGNDKVQITGTVQKLTGESKNIDFPLTTAGNNGNISKTLANLPIGSYQVSIVGTVGSKPVFGINDVVVVSPNATTQVSYTFSGTTATTNITVINNLVLPLKGTITPSLTSDKYGLVLDLSITNPGIPESVYKKDGTIKDVIVKLYAEDYKYQEFSFAFNPTGVTTLSRDVIPLYGPTYYSAVFYLDGVPDSMGSAKIKINYNPTDKTMTVIPISEQSSTT